MFNFLLFPDKKFADVIIPRGAENTGNCLEIFKATALM